MQNLSENSFFVSFLEKLAFTKISNYEHIVYAQKLIPSIVQGLDIFKIEQIGNITLFTTVGFTNILSIYLRKIYCILACMAINKHILILDIKVLNYIPV